MSDAQHDDGAVFLGHRFQPVQLADKVLLQDYLRRYPQRVSGYSFAMLSAWAIPYGVMWARAGQECLLLSRTLGASKERHLLQPIGEASAGCCSDLLSEATKLPYCLKMVYVARDYIDKNKDFCGHFAAEEDRGGANDIYARLVAHYIGKYIPGNPSVIPRNMPGAGSVVAANYLFTSAPKDGSVLGLLVPTLPLEERLGPSDQVR